MEQDVVDQPVDVLQELPRQPGLPDAGGPDHRHESGVAVPARRMEQVLDLTKLVIAADERGLEMVRAVPAATFGHDPDRPPRRHRAGLALEGLLAGLLEDHGHARGALGRFADQDRARGRDGLEPARGVDEVTRDHALVRGSERHGCFAGQHACPRLDPGSEGADRVDELEPGSDGSLGIVLVGRRRAPDGHHGIADELLDRAAVASDDISSTGRSTD